MPRKRFYSLGVLLTVFAVVISACAPAVQPATEAPATTEATQAPVATEPAATEATGPTSCPAITVADMQGVAPGAYPEQFELSEFEAAANCTLTLTGRDKYDDRLVQYGFLPSGDLPALEDRLPEEPLVVVPYDTVGKYGGRITGAVVGPEAGNSEWLSVRHVNLLRFADDLQTIVPNMAKSFAWNSDYTELTITLRKGHKWSDGQPFTSEDIDFWWNDIVMNKDLYADVPSYWIYGGEPMKVEAVDDVTVKFKFAVPSPAFTTLLATTYTHEWAPKHFLMDKLPKYNPNADADAKTAGFDSWTAQFIPLYYSDWEDANHQYGLPKLEAWIKVTKHPSISSLCPILISTRLIQLGNSCHILMRSKKCMQPRTRCSS